MNTANVETDATLFTGATPCVLREILVLNRDGLHIQPAAELVELARKFKSAIHFVVDGQRYATRTILDVLSADLRYGKRAALLAEGPDAEAAATAVQQFVAGLARQPSEAATGHWPNHLQSGGASDPCLKRVA